MRKLKLENIFERMNLDFMTEDMDEQLIAFRFVQNFNDILNKQKDQVEAGIRKTLFKTN